MPDQLHLLSVGDLVFNPLNGRVTTPGPDPGHPKVAHLTPIQTDLLKYLMKHPGVPHSDIQILHHVWGEDSPDDARHTVRQHIRSIRLKIEPDPSKPIYLVTRIRFGYMVPAN